MKREVNYSNWREDLREVVDVPPLEPKTPKTPRREVKENEKVNNIVVINPTMSEANEVFKEIGGIVLDIQETEKIKEEASDAMKDRHLEIGGMGARVDYNKPPKGVKTGPMSDAEKKKADDARSKAIAAVRASMTSKYGKGAIMNT
jgi:hypothetical protein